MSDEPTGPFYVTDPKLADDPAVREWLAEVNRRAIDYIEQRRIELDIYGITISPRQMPVDPDWQKAWKEMADYFMPKKAKAAVTAQE